MRDWLRHATQALQADFARSADTHLFPLELPGFDGIDLYLKDESSHPSGSLKHRLARSMFLYGLANGWIDQGTTIVEASSGSTAISEAYFARLLGLPFVAVIPHSTSPEKIKQIEQLDGRCELVAPSELYDAARRLADDVGGHYMDQFTYAERATDWRGNNNIAESIFAQMAQERHPVPTWIVVGAGTGGTSATIGRYIRSRCLDANLCVVDPEFSVFFDHFVGRDVAGIDCPPSRIEGIGRARVEPSFLPTVVDRMVKVSDAASIGTIHLLERVLHRRCGGSTGTNVWAMLRIASRMRERGETGSLVTLICDGGYRYRNSYYDHDWLAAEGIDPGPAIESLERCCAGAPCPTNRAPWPRPARDALHDPHRWRNDPMIDRRHPGLATVGRAGLVGLSVLGVALAAGAATTTTRDVMPTVPDGFTIEVVHDGVGPARHMTVRSDGTIYVALRRQVQGGGIAVVEDTDGDGRADRTTYVGDVQGTGSRCASRGCTSGTDDSVVRYRLDADQPLPTGDPEVIVRELLDERQHAAKPIAFDGAGNLYVNIGAPSNGCQERDRRRGSPGLDPCPILETSGGIWRFSAETAGQTQRDGIRHATGLRNCVAMAWNDRAGDLYAVQHGRDQLNTLYPGLYTDEDNAELPAEEFHRVPDGFTGGWPYTYWDHRVDAWIVSPEYGGDGKQTEDTGRFDDPIQAFPGHWAPNGLTFYHANAFPPKYRGGAFIAWHGSWNRAPLRQGGYKVTFSPMDADGMPNGDWAVFADGFSGSEDLRSPRDAVFRPMGLAVAPDGSLLMSDSVRGRIWRVRWTGAAGAEAGADANTAGPDTDHGTDTGAGVGAGAGGRDGRDTTTGGDAPETESGATTLDSQAGATP